MPRKVSSLATALILVTCLGVPARAQTEPIEIRFRLAPGEALYYTTSGSMRMSFQLLGTQQMMLAQHEGRTVDRILDVDQDGNILVETLLEDARYTFEGHTVSPPAEPLLYKITPSGQLVELSTSDLKLPEKLPSRFPNKPVSIGDSWITEINETFEGVTVQMTGTSSLIEVDRSGGTVTARIRTLVNGTVTNFDFKGFPQTTGFEMRVTGSLHGTEDLIWSVDRGREVSERMDLNFDVHIDLVQSGQASGFTMTMVMAFQSDTLPADKIPVPPPARPGMLVVPGKSIGPDALSQVLADLTKTWGEPTSLLFGNDETMSGSDRGFRSDQVGWSHGLVAHLDPADRSTVLGLAVDRPDYRTDKGLGLGSSQGAVLFAYGMSPLRVEMPTQVGAGGGVRVLVYDDLGIAFAITSDKAHAKAPGKHAPIGAVDWMVVFPPGTAGKIFPLP